MTQQADPKVSVIIPVYNGQAFVADAINSALEQTHDAIEVIAVNDGSPDKSIEVLNQFEDRIKIVDQENMGVARARNSGIESATGDFIAFLDQDDWWLPSKIQRQLEVFKSNDNIGLVHTAVTHMDGETGQTLPPLNPNAKPAEMQGDCFKQLLLGNPLYNSSVVVRSSTIADIGRCDPNLAGNTVADYELWLRIATKHQFGFVETEETCYRMHPEQGIWDRRAMLQAELAVLLNIKNETAWKAEPKLRLRLGQLYDELAVNLYDFDEFDQARHYFKKAFDVCSNTRTGLRWLASKLPPKLIGMLRN